MLAKLVVVSQLASWEDCEDAMNSIQSDQRNMMRGLDKMTLLARVKMQRLEARRDRLALESFPLLQE